MQYHYQNQKLNLPLDIIAYTLEWLKLRLEQIKVLNIARRYLKTYKHFGKNKYLLFFLNGVKHTIQQFNFLVSIQEKRKYVFT